MSSHASYSPVGPAAEVDEPEPLEQGLADFLTRQCTYAVETLALLLKLGPQSVPQDKLHMPSGLLPVASLAACKGLLFLHTVKAGAGLSFRHGSGFLIVKLSHDLAPALTAVAGRVDPSERVPLITWSAPCFYAADSVSLGLTLGVSHAHSVMVVWDQAALETILAGGAVLGANAHVLMGAVASASPGASEEAVLVHGEGAHVLPATGRWARHAHGQQEAHEEGHAGGRGEPDQGQEHIDNENNAAGGDGGVHGAHLPLWGGRNNPPGVAEAPPGGEHGEPSDGGHGHGHAHASGGAAISCYTVQDGALLDISLLGGTLHVDSKRNAALYGAAARPHDIVLTGRYQPPPQLAPLYASLDMLTAKTPRQMAAL